MRRYGGGSPGRARHYSPRGGYPPLSRPYRPYRPYYGRPYGPTVIERPVVYVDSEDEYEDEYEDEEYA